MKIIRPMELAGRAIESNAPGNEYAQWSPVGRDFLQELYSPIIGASGQYAALFDVGAGQPPLFLVDLGTGSVSTLVENTTFFGAYAVSVSPDGAYVAMRGISTNFTGPFGSQTSEIRIYSATTGLLETNFQCHSFSPVVWAPDSSALITILPDDLVNYGNTRKSALCRIATGSWAKSFSSNMPAITGNASSSAYFNFSQISISPDSSTAYLWLKSAVTTTGVTLHDQALVRVTLASMSHSSALVLDSIYHTEPLGAAIHNPERSEVVAVVYGGSQGKTTSVKTFDDVTLAEKTTITAFNSTEVGRLTMAPDSDELIVTSKSTSPKFRRFVASTYVEQATLDSVINFSASAVCYSDDYYVFANETGGYALIDRTDDTLITQTNPTVTAGDIYTYGDRNYEALSDNNDRPDLGAQLEVPTWLDLGAINPLRMFDGKLDSRTAAPSPLTITVAPGMIANGLALFNVSAAAVQVVMDDPTDGVVYDSGEIQMLDNSAVNNWWDFFFAPYLEKADLALIDLPPYPDATLTITLSSDGGDVALGELVLGRVQNIGEAQYGTSVGIIDSSTKERDVFGNFEIIERKFSKRAEFDVSVPTSSASGMQRILAQYRATPVVWVGNMGLEATIVYGFYRDFQINFSHYSLSDATITVEGL